MTVPVELRQLAAADVEMAIDHYVDDGGPDVAGGFVDELEAAFDQLATFPRSGSLRYAYELDLPGLRNWPLSTFPYVVFSVDRAEKVDVWRVLHAHRDLPGTLAP